MQARIMSHRATRPVELSMHSALQRYYNKDKAVFQSFGKKSCPLISLINTDWEKRISENLRDPWMKMLLTVFLRCLLKKQGGLQGRPGLTTYGGPNIISFRKGYSCMNLQGSLLPERCRGKDDLAILSLANQIYAPSNASVGPLEKRK